ncbi:hypothetical protein N665_1243s0001 [Sinapis alba]|nr:hypothetical protein N665_1243s0001 [Sinapis alba]
MSFPIRRCSLKGKAIATTSNSDNSSSPWLRGPKAITLGGMILRPTSEDLAELNENERSAVQFSLELEEREALGQVAVDDVMQETEPSSRPENNPDADADSAAKDKASAEKTINLALADLLPMRWTGADFEFDEEIDPEQERRLSVKKNKRWKNHFPTRSTFKSVCRLVLQTSPPAGFSFLVPADHQRPWTPPAGYACVYESWFTNCSLWLPLPKFLTSYCHRRKIALSQYTANGIRILVTLTVLAAELGIKMSARLFEELTTPSITVKMGVLLWENSPKVQYRLSKWSQGGSRSFLEEVEPIRTLSHQHWPNISEERIQAALNRINRAEIATERNRNQRIGKLNLSSLPSHADTISTPVHGHDSPGDSRPAKRRRFSTADEVALSTGPDLPPQSERPEERLSGDNQEPEVHETSLFEPLAETEVAITDEILAEEYLADLQTEEPQGDQPQDPDQTAHGDEVVEYLHLIDFKYQHTDIPFVEDYEALARLFRQIKLKKKGMPELEQLWHNSRYREMTRAGAIRLRGEDEGSRREAGAEDRFSEEEEKIIAELAYKCGAYEERAGTLESEKNEAVELAELERSCNELLFKELEELKAQNEGLDEHGSNMTAFSPKDIEDLRS